MLKYAFLIGAAATCFGLPALAQEQIITENVNNHGIPRQAPPLSLGQIYGLNPCATGATAGLTTPLFGIAGAISNIDRECETRNNAAVVVTALKDETMAREILCQIKDVRDAAQRMGKPCLQDRRVAEAQPPMPVAAITVPANTGPANTELANTGLANTGPGPVNIVPANGPVPGMASPRPDSPAFCHAKNLALYLYPECTGDGAKATLASATAEPPSSPVIVKKVISTLPPRRPEHMEVKRPTPRTAPVAPTVAPMNVEPLSTQPSPVVNEPGIQSASAIPACSTDCARELRLHLMLQLAVNSELHRRAILDDHVRVAAK